MKSNLRLKLSIIMIVSTILFSFSIATVDHFMHRDQIIKHNVENLQHVEDSVMEALKTIEKAYHLFDQDTDQMLRANTNYLLSVYDEIPEFDQWDFAQLRDVLGVDIYIINEKNVITHSSLEQDVGLDFRDCCRTLSNILNERRKTGNLYIDNMDVEQFSGEVKKYSYMATPDRKYMIQLSLSLHDNSVFNEFNFIPVVKELKEKYRLIDDIRILNLGGLPIGESNDLFELSSERREAFLHARTTRETTEVTSTSYGEEEVIYRYIYYEPVKEMDDSEVRIIEISYNENELQSTLNQKFNRFIIQLIIVLFVIAIVAFVIHRWVSKQVYFAYHDSLTELKNRTAFDEQLATELEQSNGLTALMMMDLDNFKLVNDYLGHLKGDYLLQLIAKTVQSTIKEPNEAFRLGGDEFAVLMPSTSKEEIHETAQQIINALSKSISTENELRGLNITASIGISIAPIHGKYPETLYKKADIAMYNAKEKGKNRYQVYTEKFEDKNIF